MSKKLKIIIGIIGGLVGLFILLFVGALIISFVSRSSPSYPGEYLPTSPVPTPLMTENKSPLTIPDLGRENDMEITAPEEPPLTAADPDVIAGPSLEIPERKVIKIGEIGMTVESTEQTVSDLTSLAERAQGFVQSSYVYESSEGTKSGTVVIKVPAEKFETIFREIKDMASVVLREQISGQDVTEKYVDLQARLKNAHAEEAQYLEILESATEVQDMLNVSSYLAAVRERIEVLEGQLQYLENLTAMATLTVNLSEETQIVVGPVEKWKPYQTVKRAVKSLLVTLQKTIDSLIWIIIFGVGLLLPIGIVIWLIVKLIKRLIRRRKEKKQARTPQTPQV